MRRKSENSAAVWMERTGSGPDTGALSCVEKREERSGYAEVYSLLYVGEPYGK